MPSILRDDPVVATLKQVLRELKILNQLALNQLASASAPGTDRLDAATAAVDAAAKKMVAGDYYRPTAPMAPQASAQLPSAIDLDHIAIEQQTAEATAEPADPDDALAEPAQGDASIHAMQTAGADSITDVFVNGHRVLLPDAK